MCAAPQTSSSAAAEGRRDHDAASGVRRSCTDHGLGTAAMGLAASCRDAEDRRLVLRSFVTLSVGMATAITSAGRRCPPPIVDRVGDTAEDLVRTAPTLEDYLHLRTASGLMPKSAAQGQGALAGSWCWSVVQREGRAVAMGRVIGDGGWYFHIADMATLPEHQGRGLGRRVLDDLLAQIDGAAPAQPYVTLIADAPGRRLYESRGFVETAPRSLGMRLAH